MRGGGMQNISELLSIQAKKNPNNVALVAKRLLESEDEQISFSQLESLSNGFSNAFLDKGIRKGDLVVILLPISIELYASVAGLFKIGAIPVLYEPKEIKEQLKSTFDQIKPSAILTTPLFNILLFPLSEYRNSRRLVLGNPLLVFGAQKIALTNFNPVMVLVDSNFPAIVTFTSGSEGVPKGICRTHGFLKIQNDVVQSHLKLSAKSKVMSALPVFVMNFIACGASTIIPKLENNLPWKVDAKEAVRKIQDYKIEMMMGAPSFFSPIADYCIKEKIKLVSVTKIYVGGGFLENELIRKLKEIVPKNAINIIYGSTEAEPVSFASYSDIENKEYGHGRYCVGKPIRQAKVKVVEFERGRMKKFKAASFGELVVGGVHVNDRYLPMEPSWTENKFMDGKTLWHRMGDAAFIDSKGRIWLFGRFKQLSDSALANFKSYILLQSDVSRLGYVRRSSLVSGKEGDVFWIQTRGKESLFVENQMKVKLKEMAKKRGFEVSEVKLCKSLPLDRRHNSKIDYSKLKNYNSPTLNLL